MSRPPRRTSSSSRPRRQPAPVLRSSRAQEIAFRTAYLITRNAADAEDAAQTGLVKAWQALPRFRPGAPVRPWLLAIVANEARNRRRAEGPPRGLALRATHELPSGGAALSPEGRVLAAEQRAELLAALERLREEDRLVLSCRYLLELGEDGRRASCRSAAARSSHGRRARSSGCAPSWGRAHERAQAPSERPAGRDRLAGDADLRACARAPGRRASRSCIRSRWPRRRWPCSRACSRSHRAHGAPSSSSSSSRGDGRAGRDAASRCPTTRLRRAGQPRGGRAARRFRAPRRRRARRGLRARADDGLARLRPRRPAAPRRSRSSGTVWDGFVKKAAGTGTTVEEVSVDGERGLFVTGDDHYVMFVDENSMITDRPTCLAGTVACSGTVARSCSDWRAT